MDDNTLLYWGFVSQQIAADDPIIESVYNGRFGVATASGAGVQDVCS